MSFQKVKSTYGSLVKAVTELQNLKQVIVTGAAAATDIAIAGIKLEDTIVGALNLTDLTHMDVTGVKASCAGTGNYDSTLEINTTGVEGNGYTFTLIGDSPVSGGVTIDISVALKTIVIHYESDVSTVANVNTAVTALTTYKDIVDVKTAGTTTNILTAPGHNIAAKAFTGGIDANINELPVITSAGNVQFPLSITTNKKVLITYYVSPLEG